MKNIETKQLLIYFMVSLFTIYGAYGNLISGLLAITLFFYILTINDYNVNFIAMCSAAVFAPMMVINKVNVFFILSLFASLKLVFKNLELKVNFLGYIFGFLLLLLELIGDFGNVQVGRFVYVLSMLLYFVAFILYGKLDEDRFSDLLRVMIFTFSAAIFGSMILSDWNIGLYIQSTNNLDRFGNDAKLFGGALDLPIYILFIISSLTVSRFTLRLKFEKVYYILGFIAFIFGFLTISRVYILGLLLLCIILVPASLIYWRRRVITFLLIAFLLLCAVYYLNYENANLILSRFVYRTQTIDFAESRLFIFSETINYLMKNPMSFLFGSGAKNYVVIGSELGYSFSFMAHNVLLDLVMSWGLIGLLSMTFLLSKFCSRLTTLYERKPTIFSIIPFFVIFGSLMTGGSFSYFNTYIYLITTVMFAFAFGKERHS